MRATFVFNNPGYFSPSHFARLLVDVDGLFFISVALADEKLQYLLAQEPFEEYGYETFIYLHRHVDDDESPMQWRNSKIVLTRAKYNSPPKISVRMHASFDAQKIVKSVLEFLKFLLLLRQEKDRLNIISRKERQEQIVSEIHNVLDLAQALDDIKDPELRDRFREALVRRIDPIVFGEDYPVLRTLETRGPLL